MEKLHKQGFIVHRNAFALDDACVQRVRSSEFNLNIFNDIDTFGKIVHDGQRKMTREGGWKNEFRNVLLDFLKRHGYMNCRNGKKSIDEVFAIRSYPKCSTQPRHADSAAEASLRHKCIHDVPLAVLYALDQNTSLKVWPFDCTNHVMLHLNPGDLIIFRGDLGHAGCAYDKQNTRIHAYIDSSAPECKRIKGETYITQ